MKTNTEGKIRQSGESLVLGEKYDHPAWKNNECHAKVKPQGGHENELLKRKSNLTAAVKRRVKKEQNTTLLSQFAYHETAVIKIRSTGTTVVRF